MTSLLDTLDITLWQARMTLPGAKKTLNYQSFTLVDVKQNLCGVILIERGASLSEKEMLLLQSILATAGMALGVAVPLDQIGDMEVKLLVVSDVDTMPVQIDAQLGHKDTQHTYLPHPSQCLLSAQSKRQAWAGLVANGFIR